MISLLAVTAIVLAVSPDDLSARAALVLALGLAVFGFVAALADALSHRLYAARRYHDDPVRAALHGAVAAVACSALAALQLLQIAQPLGTALILGVFFLGEALVLARR